MCLGEIFPDGKIMNQGTRKIWKELPCIFSTSSIVRFITSSCVMAIVHSCGEHQSSPVSARWVFFFFLACFLVCLFCNFIYPDFLDQRNLRQKESLCLNTTENIP